MTGRSERLRQLPKIDELLQLEALRALKSPRWAVVEALRREVDRLRRGILDGSSDEVAVDVAAVTRLAGDLARPSLRPVVNATGVVLHTNLGRAPLAAEALRAAAEVAGGYSNLEYDVEPGRRGSRHGHVTELLRALTGAEDAVVVNNNAGAVLLGLAALCQGREAIVSRGELVEIGGSFRIPDVMRLSGARLVEVGTTNKTRLADYEAALGEGTGLLLKVHRSNFAIVGFTEEAGLEQLAALGRRRGVATMMDLGSGALWDRAQMQALGFGDEPTVAEAVATGAELVCFSGDKLLGGPQAGILAGRAEAIAACRRHPLMRALRPDKLTLAALGATLALYRDGRAAEVPAAAMLSASRDELSARARALIERVGATAALSLAVVEVDSAVGGGALPTAPLPSAAVAVTGAPPHRLDARLRAGEVPVVGRIADDRLLLDVRTLWRERDVVAVAEALRRVDGEERVS